MEKEVLSIEPFGTWTLSHERWRMGPDEEWLRMEVFRNGDGEYIGDRDQAEQLASMGIEPEYAQPDHATCSIGFCAAEGKWYGWSHRALYGFGVGDEVSEGDCTASSGWIDGIDPRTGERDPLPLPVGFVAKDLEDCKRMAMAFAASVS